MVMITTDMLIRSQLAFDEKIRTHERRIGTRSVRTLGENKNQILSRRLNRQMVFMRDDQRKMKNVFLREARKRALQTVEQTGTSVCSGRSRTHVILALIDVQDKC